MMNETICSPPKEQGVFWTEEPKTSHINVGSEVIKEDPFVVLDIESPGTAHKHVLGSNTTPDLAASTFWSQYELLNKALEPADADWTPEENFMHQMALGLYQPLLETELGPVMSPRRMHPPPTHPFESTEDILLNGEVDVIQEHAPLDEGPSNSFMKPEDTPVTAPVLDSTSLFPFAEISKNINITAPDFDSFQALQLNDQGPSCMTGLDHCLTLQCFEAAKATMVSNQENHSKWSYANSQPQFGLPDPLYDTNMDWEEQARQAKSQQQLLCSTQASQPQHFQDHLRSAPSSTNSPWTHPHLNSSQLPVLLDTNYPKPIQLLYSAYFPLGTPSDVNYEYLPPPAVHETRFNLASSTFENSPLVPQVDLNSVSPVSPLTPNHLNHTLPQMNTSWHLPHPNPQTPFWPCSLERPPVGESSYGQSMDSLSQKFFVNYRLWQMYCKVAKSVYARSPDAEALACFFIPAIRSVCLQCPETLFVEAVKKALSEWEKHSNFDRMDYYHTARRFMKFEEHDLKRLWAVDQAAAHQEAAQPKQTPKHEQSGSTQKPSSSKAAGSSVRTAKGGSRKSHGAQASRKTVQELAEEAQRAYSEIMEDLETRNKKQSEDARDEEEVHEEEEEKGSFTEYLNEFCSQATFLNEAGADIDLDYISSLLLSDSNPTDMLMPPEVQDNAQNVSPGVAPPEELHPPPQTFSAPFSPTLQPGLYMAEGKIVPPLASFKIPASINQPNHMNCPSINPEVPLTTQQFQVPAACSGIHFPPFQNFIPQRTFEMLPPPPGPSPQSQMPSGGPSPMQGHFFPANCFTPAILVQDDVGSFNRHEAFQAIPPTTISSSYNQDREILTLPMREIKAESKNQNHSDLQNVHLWPSVTSQVTNNCPSSVPHQSLQSNSSDSVSLESGSSQNATEPALIFTDKNDKYSTSSQIRTAIAGLETKDGSLGSVSKTSSQEVEPSQSILVDANSCDHQSIDTNVQVMAKQKSDSSDDVDPSKIITVGNELMSINEENENVSTVLLEKQKMKESMPDIQEDSDGTYSALFPEEAKTETVCSDELQLLEKILNESVDHQAERLLKPTCTPSCSDQDSPTSTKPPVILSPLSLTVPHFETLKEISETCLETRKAKDGQLSLPSMYEEGAVSPIRSPCSVELSNLPCDVKSNCSNWESALIQISNCFTDISETKIPSNDFTLDNVLSDFLFILDKTEKRSFIEKAPSGSLDKTKTTQDDTKPVKSKMVAIPQTEMDQILQDTSQTEEQLNTSTQPGAATDYKTHFNVPQLFSLEEPVHVPTNESSSQSSTVTVTQNQSTKPDPVTNDHSGKMREPIMRPDKTQEENLVNTTNVLDCMDLNVPSKLSAIKLDSTSSDDGDDDDDDDEDTKLAAHVLLSPKDITAEIPLELLDEGLETDGSLKDSLANGTEEDTETKEMNAEVAEELDNEGTLAVEDEDKVSSEKSKNMKRKKPHIGKQTYVKNKVQTTEMLSTTMQEGNASTGEKTTAEDSLCMSEEKIGQDPKTEGSLHEQDKSSTPKNRSVLPEEKESNTGKKRQSGPMESPNQCDDQKTGIGDGREREHVIVIASTKVAQMKEKIMATDNVEKELTLKKTGVNRQGQAFHRVPNEKNPTEQKLENSSVTLEKGRSKNLKNIERHTRKDRLQRKEDSTLTKKTETVPRAAKKSIVSLEVSSFLSEAPSESQDGSCNSTETFESVEEREQKKSTENQAADSHQNTSKVKINILKHKRLEKSRSYETRSTKRAEVAQKVEDQRNEGLRSTGRSNRKKHKRESVKNSTVKKPNDDAQLNRSTSTMRSCAASMAEETAEKHTKINKRDLSSLASEGNDSERCGRRLKSDASVSKDTTMTKRRETIGGHGQGSTQKQGSDGNSQERTLPRTWTASQRIQFEQREKDRESLGKGICKSSPDQKRRAEISRERSGVEEMQEKTDKREEGVKGCRIRRSAKSLITTAEQEMIRKEAEKGRSHEQRKLCQQSRRQCRNPKSQAKTRFLRKRNPLVLQAPQTRPIVERRNDGQKENLTRAKEVNSKRSIESRPIKKQKSPQKLMSGLQIETANLKTPSLEAKDIPSSSQTPRQIRKGSPTTSDSPRERRAEKKGQQGSVRVHSVHFKKTEQENAGNAWKRQKSGSTECARENGKKAQANETEARKTENEKQKKQLKGGIRVRWSARLKKKRQR